MREGITYILGMHDDVRVVAEASNGQEAVAMYERHRPDVTLMDLQMPKVNGLDATRAIRRIDPPRASSCSRWPRATRTSTARCRPAPSGTC